MERLSLQGDFFDCQLYGGRLYLWTFNGSLQVFNYHAVIEEWVKRRQNLYTHHEPYEHGMSNIYISTEELQRCLISERDYLTDEFPTGTEVLAGELFEANAKGLFGCKIPLFKKMMPVVKLSDVPLVHISGAQRRGLVCSGGSDGVFFIPSVIDEKKIVRLSEKHAIRAAFCNPGIYAYSSVDDSYLLVKNGSDYNTIVKAHELYPEEKQKTIGPKMTWSWGNEFYIAKNHNLKVYEYVSPNEPLRFKDEIRFFYWKGDFVSAGSSKCGTIVELDNAICLFENMQQQDGCCTISEPVTRWRMYPRSREYSSHIHIVFDDRMDIVVMNGEVRSKDKYGHLSFYHERR